MQPITLFGVLLCFGVLYWKYQIQRSQAISQTGTKPVRVRGQRMKTAKLLWGALLVWMAVSFALQRLNANIDGVAPPPSIWERLVNWLSG